MREWQQLQQTRDKARADAEDTISRNYRNGLEALYRRASQTNDLQSVAMLRAELEKLGAPAPLGQSNQTPTETGSALLTKRLVGTKWVWFGKETITLLADGKAEWSTGKQIWPWKVTSVGHRTIEGMNMARKQTFTITFDRDLKTGTIESAGATRATHISSD